MTSALQLFRMHSLCCRLTELVKTAGFFDDGLHGKRRQIVLAQDLRMASVVGQRRAGRVDHAGFLTNTSVRSAVPYLCKPMGVELFDKLIKSINECWLAPGRVASERRLADARVA